MAAWQVQQAKSRFSQLLTEAQAEGPQVITSHGKETAVVVSIEDFRRHYTPPPASKMDFVEFLLSGPKFDSDDEVDELFARDKDTGRDVEL